MKLVRNFCLIHRVELDYEHHNGRLWCDKCKEYIDNPLRMYQKLDPDEVLIYDKTCEQDIIERECNLDEYVNLRKLGNDRFEDGINPDPDDWETQSKFEGLG